jgi:hypothetical protein
MAAIAFGTLAYAKKIRQAGVRLNTQMQVLIHKPHSRSIANQLGSAFGYI